MTDRAWDPDRLFVVRDCLTYGAEHALDGDMAAVHTEALSTFDALVDRAAALSDALQRIADTSDPLLGIGSEVAFAREALHELSGPLRNPE